MAILSKNGGAVNLPPDLLKDSSSPTLNADLYQVVISDLEPNSVVPIQFAWVYPDKTVSEYSVSYDLNTSDEATPNTPAFINSDVEWGNGFLKVTWNGKDATGADLKNIKQVNIWISGGTFGATSVKTGHFFTGAGTKTIALPSGTYYVKLQAETALGKLSGFSTEVTSSSYRKPGVVSTLTGTWSDANKLAALYVGFSFNPAGSSSTTSNAEATAFYVKLTWNNSLSKTYSLPVDKTKSSYVFTIDENEIRKDFNGFFRSIFDIEVYAINTANIKGDSVTITSNSYVSSVGAPSIGTITPGENSYTITWDQSTNPTVEAIYIEEVINSSLTDPGTGYTFKKKSIDNPVTVSTNTDVRWVRCYYVTFTGQQRPYSTPQRVAPLSANASDNIPPNAPSNFAGTAYNDSTDSSGNTGYIVLSWTASSSTDTKGYTVKFGRASNDLTTYVTFNGTSGRIDNLRSGTTYYFQIAANDGVNDSSFIPVTPISVSVPKDNTAPSAPSGLNAVAGFNNIIAYWTRNSEADVDLGMGTYQFQLSTSNVFGTILQDRTVTGTVASFTGLTTDTIYYIRVRAIDSSGNVGAWSVVVNATPGKINAAASITNGTIIGDLILTNTIVGDRIIANTIDADRLKSNSIITGKINVGATGKIVIDGTLADPAIYMGTGTYANSNTPVYLANVSGVGKFSLGDKLTWDGTLLSITGGITITGSSTITLGNLGVTGASAKIYAGASPSTGRRVEMTLSGLFGYDGTTEIFSISNNTGKATFNVGAIAGWDVTATQIAKSGIILDSASGYVSVSTILSSLAYSAGIMAPTSTSSVVLWAGQVSVANRGSAVFKVTADGKMTATNANFSGTITSSTLTTSTGTDRIEVLTNQILFYDSLATNNPGKIYAGSHGFYITAPGSGSGDANIQVYGANAGGSLSSTIRFWAGSAGGSTTGLTLSPIDGILRNGNVGGSGNSSELRNIEAANNSSDLSGSATSSAFGTIRLHYTV
jgi:hypothetical protein